MTAVVLAAGKSTRMKSELPKVLHGICGQPMLSYVLDACEQAGVARIILVVGHGKEKVIEAYSDRPNVCFVEQNEQKGTGHAVLVCRNELAAFAGRCLVIAADMPLVQSATLTRLLEENARTRDGVTMATTILDDPTGYGRILRDGQSRLIGVVEHRDCTPEQLRIRECNPSYYCFDSQLMFKALDRVGNDNAKGEYYITDAVRILIEMGAGGGAIAAVPPEQAMGINSRADLAAVTTLMQARIQAEHMQSGVTIEQPCSTWIESGVTIGADTVIRPFAFLARGAVIGSDCTIGPFAWIPEGQVITSGSSVSSSAGCAGVEAS